ncbi:hypothetical protein D039_2000B, partial [Vibrio parahaemolyticus EKP-028]
AFSST